VLAAVLALASAITWGTADFLGGLQSRRHSLLAVVVLSQLLALVLLVVAILAGAPIEHDASATLWAASVGALGVLGLVAFYRALAIGTMSVVAPISATGVSIPVLFGLLSGERPGALQVAGIALACAGVVLAAREAPGADEQARRAGRTAIGLALLAAVGFGTFLTGMDQAEESGDAAWVLLSARVAEAGLLLLVAAFVRPRLPRARTALAAIATVGALDLLANLLFVIAASKGLLSVVGVLGSLYPAVTVVLARFVLHERLTPTQNAGVLVTLAGVVALAAG
jgi:drug/metabolite transporter (DMT)-like permease